MRPQILLPLAALLLSACSSTSDTMHHEHGGSDAGAVATLRGRAGSPLTGHATFVERNGGVQVTITVENAPPGWHAAHVHEVGDCSAADFTSTGGHFNPDGHVHGSPDAAQHHAGDLGNMWVDENGRGYHALFMPELTVAAGSHSVVGRAVIIHEAADDLVTQPTGAAGGRIACGEIN